MKNTNKKITNKELQSQIDALKASLLADSSLSRKLPKATTAVLPKATAAQRKQKTKTSDQDNQAIDIKSTVTINPLRSSLMILYLFSWIGFLSNKLPFLSKFAPILKRLIGKTPFWTALIFMRKGFVLINVLIAMYFIAKLAGWDQGSFLGAFVGMGTVYVDIFTNFIKTSFSWILELFDMKIVPQVPKDKPNFPFSPSNSPGWFTKPVVDNNYLDIAEKAKSWYTSPIAVDTPWYRDWSWTSLFYVLGGIVIIGGGFMAYSYFTAISPSSALHHPNPGTPPVGPNPPAPPEIQVTGPETSASSSVAGLIGTVLGIPKYLNPFKYIPPHMTSEQLAHCQSNNNIRMTVYPYSQVDPTQPWYTRLRVNLIGESAIEKNLRELLVKNVLGGSNDRSYYSKEYLQSIGRDKVTLQDIPSSSGTIASALGIHAPLPSSEWTGASRIALSPKAPTLIPLPSAPNFDPSIFPGGSSAWVNNNTPVPSPHPSPLIELPQLTSVSSTSAIEAVTQLTSVSSTDASISSTSAIEAVTQLSEKAQGKLPEYIYPVFQDSYIEKIKQLITLADPNKEMANLNNSSYRRLHHMYSTLHNIPKDIRTDEHHELYLQIAKILSLRK